MFRTRNRQPLKLKTRCKGDQVGWSHSPHECLTPAACDGISAAPRLSLNQGTDHRHRKPTRYEKDIEATRRQARRQESLPVKPGIRERSRNSIQKLLVNAGQRHRRNLSEGRALTFRVAIRTPVIEGRSGSAKDYAPVAWQSILKCSFSRRITQEP
jgi:hypothetical protein